MTNLEQITQENYFTRPFSKIAYAIKPEKVVLDNEQYAHVQNKQTGNVELVEGSTRHTLKYDERLVGEVQEKITVPEKHFIVIDNPYDQGTNSIKYGEREVRVGPNKFSLRPGEKLAQKPRKEFVLTKYDSLLVKALKNIDEHTAGEKFLIQGPATYIPPKEVEVLKTQRAIPLSDTDGIYVQNEDNGDVNLVVGPIDYFLQPNERLYEKELTNDELAALGLKAQGSRQGVRILTRQAANTSFLENNSNALVLELEDNEIVLLQDGSDTRIERGPKTTFIGPYERPKVLTLSGGKPIEQGALKIALVKLGPDFIYDQITVRTNDNAQLKVDVSYKWRFNTNGDLKKLFSIDDFVGYAAETLSSEIRSVAAEHDFEDFHAKSLDYIKEAIFNEDESKVFEENGLEIFGVDVTAITPEDRKIAEKLHEAIKSNMDIYCKKLVLKATLEAEKQEVEGKKQIEGERKELIESQVANERLLAVENANTEAEAYTITEKAKADAILVEAEAQAEAEKLRLGTVIHALQEEGGQKYLDLIRAQRFDESEKLIIVPENSKIVLGKNGEL